MEGARKANVAISRGWTNMMEGARNAYVAIGQGWTVSDVSISGDRRHAAIVLRQRNR